MSREARALIDRSRSSPTRVLRLVRTGRKDMLLRGGNRVLFLAEKVARARRSQQVLVEPLTNVWDDIAFQGIAREGGVALRAEQEAREAARSHPRDVDATRATGCLTPFLGSGTTAAVAHKMGRQWIGIEQGAHVDALCIPRLRRVVDGEDPSGVTRAAGWQGGGGFHVWT